MTAIGLDYGTTNSVLTVYQDNMSGDIVEFLIPSCRTRNGASPKRMLNSLSRATTTDVRDIKEHIGKCLEKLFIWLKTNVRELDLTDVKLAITVPNAFKDSKVKFMKSITLDIFSRDFPNAEGELDIIPEPISAALYYAYLNACLENDIHVYCVVSDMGGGTTDTAIVRIDADNRNLKFEVICSEEEAELGGIDIDKAIIAYFRSKLSLDSSEVSDDELIRPCRFLKEQLSFRNYASTAIIRNDDTTYARNGEQIELTLKRNEFDVILNNCEVSAGNFIQVYIRLLERLQSKFRDKLVRDGFSDDEIGDIMNNRTVLLPVGGSSRIPKLQRHIKDVFPSCGIFTLRTENDSVSARAKFDTVCRGAAIYSAYTAGLLRDRIDNIEIIGRTLHRIALRYTSEKLVTCVGKAMQDGTHCTKLTPKAFLPDGRSFRINTLEFYQGGNGSILDNENGDCERACPPIVIPDVIYTDIRDLEKIIIHLYVTILHGRMTKIRIQIPGCHLKGKTDNFDKTINLE